MGALYEYNCPKCGYKADVAGGFDVGMARYYSVTIACYDCADLHDVELLEPIRDREPDDDSVLPGSPPRWRQHKLRCPEDSKHRWEPFMGFCPVCSTRMDVDRDRPSLMSD